jgi:NADH-quinone oxidoreductase subunit J
VIELLVFIAASAMVLVGAVGVVTRNHPVHAALSLILTLFGVAVHFVALEANFLAAVQVIVYAGAIVVLFLFVIMLLGVDQSESLDEPLRFQRPVALALGVILFAEVVFLIGHQWATGASSSGTQHAIHGGGAGLGGNVERVARSLFTDFLWPFEITAVLLVLAVVGAVVLARRSSQGADAVDAREVG